MILNRSQIYLWLLVGIMLIGCRREDAITRYEVPKDRSGLEHLRESSLATDENPEVASTEKDEDDRMVVAIALRDDATWFFKINGSVSRVNGVENQWRPFLKSIKFNDEGKPEWDLPEGWKTTGQKPMRFATLVLDDQEPPLEVAVSSLSAGQDVLLNVNRWRGQLGLEPIAKGELDDVLTTIQARDESLTIFDATGKLSDRMMPPFARPGGMRGASKATTKSVEFKVPKGWTQGKSSPFLRARLSKSEGERGVQITVSSLSAAANKWLPNVQRWAGQVGMDSLDDAAFDAMTEPVTVDGSEGKLIRLIPNETNGNNATIAVMVKKDTNAWFFKLAGDRELVIENDRLLLNFLKSVRLP